MKEFRVLQNCPICGEGFDSDYELMKHTSTRHPKPEKSGWMGEEDSCSCGGEHSHYHGHF